MREAQDLIDEYLEFLRDGETNQNRLYAEISRREAEALINGKRRVAKKIISPV